MGSFYLLWWSLSRSIVIRDARLCCLAFVILSAFLSWNFEFCKDGGSGSSSLVLWKFQKIWNNLSKKKKKKHAKQTDPDPSPLVTCTKALSGTTAPGTQKQKWRQKKTHTPQTKPVCCRTLHRGKPGLAIECVTNLKMRGQQVFTGQQDGLLWEEHVK